MTNPGNRLTGSARGQPKVRMNPVAFSYLMAELYNGASSVKDLVEACGLKNATIRDYLRELKSRKLVYIAGHGRNSQNCPCIPLYQWGPGKRDVPVPKMTAAEKARKYRRNKREREVRTRLTLLGARAGPHTDQAGEQIAPAVDERPNPGQQQVVQCTP